MPFNINDTILYASHGICQIQGIVEKNFNGRNVEYYVLKPVYEKDSIIYVPTNNDVLKQKMRRVLSSSEIYELIRAMPDEKSIWIENENIRKEKFKAILAKGDRRELVQLIRTLYLHQQDLREKGKKLHVADERFFKDAEKLLYDEFALVLQIKREQVVPFIVDQIEIQRR